MVPVLLQGEGQGVEGWGVLSSPCCPPWDPMASHSIAEGLKYQMNRHILMGLAASGVSPSRELMSSFSRASGPAASHIWTTDLQQWQPETLEARGKMEVTREEKAPRGTSCWVYDLVSFLSNKKTRDGEEDI